MGRSGLEFVVLAAVVAGAGVILARAADRIATVTQLGRLLVGSILLAAATSLPELSVDVAAVRGGMVDLAVGDLLGSSLMNLLILAGIDLMSQTGRRMLSREAASHALSATLSIALTALVGMAVLTGGRLPAVDLLGIDGWTWAVGVAWIAWHRSRAVGRCRSMTSASPSGETNPWRTRSSGFSSASAPAGRRTASPGMPSTSPPAATPNSWAWR